MTDWVRYRVVNEGGDDLGLVMSAEPSWNAGDTVHRGPAVSYKVLRVVEAEAAEEVDLYLIVATNRS